MCSIITVIVLQLKYLCISDENPAFGNIPYIARPHPEQLSHTGQIFIQFLNVPGLQFIYEDDVVNICSLSTFVFLAFLVKLRKCVQ